MKKFDPRDIYDPANYMDDEDEATRGELSKKPPLFRRSEQDRSNEGAPPVQEEDYAARPASAEPETLYMGVGGAVDPDSEQEMFDPPVGWLVVIDGPGKGSDLHIYNGYNSLGRDPDTRIPLNFGDKTVSRRDHAAFIYDLEANKYYVQHKEGKSLTKVDGELVTNVKELNGFERISIGKSTLLFVRLCTDKFVWDA